MGVIVWAACALVAVLAQSPESHADKRTADRSKCHFPGTRTLLRGPQVRVFQSRRGSPQKYACHYRTGRIAELDDPENAVYAYPAPAIAIAGPVVGFVYEYNEIPTEPSFTAVAVRNLRTGRSKRSSGWVDPAADPAVAHARVGSLKINNRGSVAWIACPGDFSNEGSPRPNCVRPGANDTVYKREVGSGEAVVLDRGVGIDPRSLKRREATISWIHDGQRRTASLN